MKQRLKMTSKSLNELLEQCLQSKVPEVLLIEKLNNGKIN